MRLAVYNIWDSAEGMPLRFEQIVGEIRKVGADVICLQETADERQLKELMQRCGYPYCGPALPDGGEWNGTGILSRYPLAELQCYPYAAAALLCVEEKKLLVVNVHLPWDGALKRERAIVDIAEQAEGIQADYAFLAGDFNCSEHSAVHRFLKGEQSLMERETSWFDLAEAYAECSGQAAAATLNFRNNPRWNPPGGTGTNTIETNQRFDRILLKNPYPAAFPLLKDCGIFGMEVSDRTGLSASDHYGVYAELEFGES